MFDAVFPTWACSDPCRTASSGRIILATIALYGICELLLVQNPLTGYLGISYPLPLQAHDEGRLRYGKGWRDLQFLAFYIVVFSFIRQSAVRYVVRPLALAGGIKGERKLERFTEQGYAFIYWSTSSLIGLVSGFPASHEASVLTSLFPGSHV